MGADSGSARRRVCRVHARAKRYIGRSPERLLLARTGDDRPASGARVLPATLRLGSGELDGYGAWDGRLSDVRVGRAAGRGHIHQTGTDSGSTVMVAVHQGSGFQEDCRECQKTGRQDYQRSDGSARWRLDRAGNGSERRDVRRSFGEVRRGEPTRRRVQAGKSEAGGEAEAGQESGQAERRGEIEIQRRQEIERQAEERPKSKAGRSVQKSRPP